jgi:DNA invertase Pin-like site-specific DNA recombinase
MLDYARAGDTVVVAAIDRLGRSVAEVTRTIVDLGERRITLRALREGVDTATPTGRAVAAIMATLAELELVVRDRRASSRESRRARRLPTTKPPKLSPERREQLRRLAATVNPSARWPMPSGSDVRPRTGIYLNNTVGRNASFEDSAKPTAS